MGRGMVVRVTPKQRETLTRLVAEARVPEPIG